LPLLRPARCCRGVFRLTDTITAQRRIRLPHRPLDSLEVCSKRWSYDDAEEYVYGKLAEVEYKGAIKDGVVVLAEIAAAARRYTHHDKEC